MNNIIKIPLIVFVVVILFFTILIFGVSYYDDNIVRNYTLSINEYLWTPEIINNITMEQLNGNVLLKKAILEEVNISMTKIEGQELFRYINTLEWERTFNHYYCYYNGTFYEIGVPWLPS